MQVARTISRKPLSGSAGWRESLRAGSESYNGVQHAEQAIVTPAGQFFINPT